MTKARPYRLVEYDDQWALDFQAESLLLRKIFGKEVVAIEHIGSTSLVGMFAKPQIDIMIIVKDLSVVVDFYKKMEELGFVCRGNYTGIGEEYFTKDNEQGFRTFSIHVLPRGSSAIRPILAFRNYLRAHKDMFDKYVQIKRELYEKYPNDYRAYDSEKGKKIQPMITAAVEWEESL